MKIIVKNPIKVIFKLKSVEDLESVLNSIEKLQEAHPDTIINIEIIVRP